MTKIYISKGLLFFLFTILCIHLQADPPSLFFKGDISQLKKQAKKTDTPYFIYFQVPNCESCDEMNKKTWNDPRINRYIAKNYLGFRVNTLTPVQSQRILKEYGIIVYPALLVFGADGKVKQHIEGYIDPETALKFLGGNPICAPLPSTQPDPQVVKEQPKYQSRPLVKGKTIPTSRQVNMATVTQTRKAPVSVTPNGRNRTASTPKTPSNVRNKTYQQYEIKRIKAQQQSMAGRQYTQNQPSSTPSARRVETRQTANHTTPIGRTGSEPGQRRINLRRVDQVSAEAPKPLPTARNKKPVKNNSGPEIYSNIRGTGAQAVRATRPAFKAVEDPRFHTYNPWQALAPVANVNHSLILDTYNSAEQVLAKVEAIKKFWPNSIWVYKESGSDSYRIALGNFRTEQQAKHFAQLLMRYQNMNSAVEDLYKVIAPPAQIP